MSEVGTNYAVSGNTGDQPGGGGDKKKFLGGEFRFVPEMFEVWKFNY